jgi:hypothetical protein
MSVLVLARKSLHPGGFGRKQLFFRRLLHGDSARVRSGSIQKRSWPRIFVSDPTNASAPSIGLERY